MTARLYFSSAHDGVLAYAITHNGAHLLWFPVLYRLLATTFSCPCALLECSVCIHALYPQTPKGHVRPITTEIDNDVKFSGNSEDVQIIGVFLVGVLKGPSGNN